MKTGITALLFFIMKIKNSVFLLHLSIAIIVLILLINGITYYTLNQSTHAQVDSQSPSPSPTVFPTLSPTQASQPTTIPTNTTTPSLSPQLLTSTPAPTAPPPTSTPTPPPQLGSTVLDFTIFLHGIGKAGDAANSQSAGTVQPVKTDFDINVELTNTSGVTAAQVAGKVIYNQADGNFKGTVTLGSDIPGGSYLVDIKVPRYLKKQIPGLLNINKSITNPMPPVYLYAGDIDDDNSLSVLDFNAMRDCYSENLAPPACVNEDKKSATDINSDGAVNQIDYNLFLRETSKSDLN